jgi:hypothetical protein
VKSKIRNTVRYRTVALHNGAAPHHPVPAGIGFRDWTQVGAAQAGTDASRETLLGWQEKLLCSVCLGTRLAGERLCPVQVCLLAGFQGSSRSESCTHSPPPAPLSARGANGISVWQEPAAICPGLGQIDEGAAAEVGQGRCGGGTEGTRMVSPTTSRGR